MRRGILYVGRSWDLEALVKELAAKYGRNQIFCTCDASGRGGSALTNGNASAWSLIESYFKKYMAAWVDFERVPTFNLGTDTSRMICNSILRFYKSRFVISEDCTVLLSDIARASVLSDGKLNKADCDKFNYGLCLTACATI